MFCIFIKMVIFFIDFYLVIFDLRFNVVFILYCYLKINLYISD